jgi:hypothetical protein
MTGSLSKVMSDKGFGFIQGEDGFVITGLTARVRRAKPGELARPAARTREHF